MDHPCISRSIGKINKFLDTIFYEFYYFNTVLLKLRCPSIQIYLKSKFISLSLCSTYMLMILLIVLATVVISLANPLYFIIIISQLIKIVSFKHDTNVFVILRAFYAFPPNLEFVLHTIIHFFSSN